MMMGVSRLRNTLTIPAPVKFKIWIVSTPNSRHTIQIGTQPSGLPEAHAIAEKLQARVDTIVLASKLSTTFLEYISDLD